MRELGVLEQFGASVSGEAGEASGFLVVHIDGSSSNRSAWEVHAYLDDVLMISSCHHYNASAQIFDMKGGFTLPVPAGSDWEVELSNKRYYSNTPKQHPTVTVRWVAV